MNIAFKRGAFYLTASWSFQLSSLAVTFTCYFTQKDLPLNFLPRAFRLQNLLLYPRSSASLNSTCPDCSPVLAPGPAAGQQHHEAEQSCQGHPVDCREWNSSLLPILHSFPVMSRKPKCWKNWAPTAYTLTSSCKWKWWNAKIRYAQHYHY